MCPKCLEIFRSQCLRTNTRIVVHINICPQTFFEIELKTSRFKSFGVLSVDTLKKLSIFSPSLRVKRTDTSQMYFRCMSNHSQLPRELGSCVTVHNQKCLYVP